MRRRRSEQRPCTHVFSADFNSAVSILSCWATVRPDAAFRGNASAVGKAERERVVNGIQNSAKIDNHLRMVNALGSRQLNPRQLIGYYLQQSPSDGENALRLLIEYEQAQQARLNTQNRRWVDLFRFMVEKKLVQDAHVATSGTKVMTWIQTPPPPVKTDVVLPVYLVVDESGAIDMGLLNAGIQGPIPRASSRARGRGARIWLSVLGLAGGRENAPVAHGHDRGDPAPDIRATEWHVLRSPRS